MKQVLITGATGNVGKEVIRFLTAAEQHKTIAAVRSLEESKESESIDHFREFDFEKPATFKSAFQNIDILFLLRPPHISEIEKYFKPLLLAAKANGINKVVFLSVQGAEKSTVIPHNKIENLIRTIGFEYIFVRPSYFMQNLTTTLLPEIKTNKTITLPSGQAKFNWIDVKNIGEATASLIKSFDQYKNQAYEITGLENKSYNDVSIIISQLLSTPIEYHSINPISFYFKKRKEGVQSGFALVMTLLHFLPRVQEEPTISDNFEKLTGKKPTSLRTFIEREKEKFI